jgi:hypothetical protein
MNYTLTFTEQEVQVLGAALAELPFKVSSNLISSIQNQINKQLPEQESNEDIPVETEE